MKTPPEILISQTYETTTPESVEAGDIEESGFVFQDVGYSFRELVELMNHGFREPSDSQGVTSGRVWLSSGWDTSDYRTGEERNESIHFSRSNPPGMEKYWIKAAKFAGI